jgi:hypothetical protein
MAELGTFQAQKRRKKKKQEMNLMWVSFSSALTDSPFSMVKARAVGEGSWYTTPLKRFKNKSLD